MVGKPEWMWTNPGANGKQAIIWTNKRMPEDSVIWTGGIAEGDVPFAEGYGTIRWYDKGEFQYLYTGLMLNGRLEGKTDSLDRFSNVSVRTWVNGVKLKKR